MWGQQIQIRMAEQTVAIWSAAIKRTRTQATLLSA